MYNILVVVDPQNDFVIGDLGSIEAQEAIKYLHEELYGAYDHIFVTMDTHHEDYLQATLEGELLPVPHCHYMREGWQIVEPIKSTLELSPTDVTYIKKCTFGSVELPYAILEHLKARFGNDCNTHNVVFTICGLDTDICLISCGLMLRAYFPNSPMYVIPEACAGSTPANHEAALKVLESCQIIPIHSEQEIE